MNSNAYKRLLPNSLCEDEGPGWWGVLNYGGGAFEGDRIPIVTWFLLGCCPKKISLVVRGLSVFCYFCPWGKGLFKQRVTSWYQRYWQGEENSLSAWLSTRYLFKVVQVFKSRAQISWNTNVRHCRWLVYGKLQNCCSQNFLYVVYETRLWSTSARH